jgi:hypothetical protein
VAGGVESFGVVGNGDGVSEIESAGEIALGASFIFLAALADDAIVVYQEP